MKDRKFILGIAGYIASGKSEAGRYLEKLGAGFIEADEVVNILYRQGGEGHRKISGYFGKEFLRKNGEINRRKLAKFVFGDVRKLKILNNLIHPIVNNEIKMLLGKKREKVVAVEAAYFDKGGLMDFVDRIIWIECKKPLLKRRVMRGSGIGADMFEKIYSCQRKPEKMDFIVGNNGRRAAMFRQLDEIYDICMSARQER